MATITVSRTVQRPAEQVWQVFTDIAGAPRNLSGVSAVEVLTDQVFGVGFRWRETRRMFGQTATEEMWVTACEEPSFYVVEADSRGTYYRSRFDFAATADGTRVEHTFTGTPSGTVAKLMDKAMSVVPKSVLARAFDADLAELAAVCERS